MCAQLIIHVIDGVLIPSGISADYIETEVLVPAPVLAEALAVAADYTLVPVIAPATSSTRRLLSDQE